MTTIAEMPKLVTVFGASGFLGRHVVRALVKRGYYIRAVSRRPNTANFLQPIGNMGQVVPIQANIRNASSIARAVEGADYVVNLVGILFEGGRQTFSGIQGEGAGAVAQAARAAGAGLTHVSAIGADANSASEYARTKAEGEAAVLAAVADAVILRPSIVFGPEDKFFNRFADMARFSPFLPVIGGGVTKLQPVYAGDVGEAVARSADNRLPRGRVYELGGPEVLSFRQCMERTLQAVGRRRRILSIPWGVAGLQGKIFDLVPLITPPITADQVTQLRNDNVVSESAKAEGRTLPGIGVEAQSLDAILPTYLWRYRVAGQFARKGEAART